MSSLGSIVLVMLTCHFSFLICFTEIDGIYSRFYRQFDPPSLFVIGTLWVQFYHVPLPGKKYHINP